ncbi:MAG: hypothetical protein ACUVTD_06250 [Nitrososphaerales archaeon]
MSFYDRTFFYDKGIPTLLYGHGSCELAHSTCEYVELKQVKDAARTIAQAIIRLLE